MPPDSTEGSSKVNLPTITLDSTLADLYRTHCPTLSRQKRIAHIFCGTTSTVSLTPSFPRNRKYIYQDGAFNDPKRAGKSDEELRRLLAPKYLSLIPQRDAFIAGAGPVIFFHSGESEEDIQHDRNEAERTLAVLSDSQRPETIFSAGPTEIKAIVTKHNIDAVTLKIIVDPVAASVPMITNADALWTLNSKAALATSGLPTPATEIIAIQGHLPPASRCCNVCETYSTSSSNSNSTSTDLTSSVPSSCTGPRNRWLGEESLRILSAIERSTLPFVCKNQQAFAGAGTYVVAKGPQRNQLLQDFTQGGILRRMLSQITPENEHLRPGDVLLMRMVKDPVADYGLTFFVGEEGEAVWLAASEQMIDRASASWIGSKISYEHQMGLEEKFGGLVQRTAAYLHSKGYVGTAGADVLETKNSDGSSEYAIVDLNVRTSGSLVLPLMRTHFTSRGLQCATSLSITVKEDREAFCRQWRGEVEAGELCVVAWFEDSHAGKSFGDVVLGAKDEDALSEFLEKVRGVSEKVTF